MSNTPSSQGMPMTMQSYDDSLARICAEAAPRPPVSRPLFESVGLVLAEDLTAPLSVPSFDNSAMDGFAFSAAAVATATPDRPIRLTVAGASIAGAEPPPPLQKGTAVKIMTGAPLPKGADTILPVEAAGGASTPGPGRRTKDLMSATFMRVSSYSTVAFCDA